MPGLQGRLLEQKMVQTVSGRVDPAITDIWSKFCVYLTPYINRQVLIKCKSFSDVFQTLKTKNKLITFGYYDRITDIIRKCDYPSARAMERCQEEIEKTLKDEDKEEIQKCKNTNPQVIQENDTSAKELEAEMINELEGEIGPSSDSQWTAFKNFLSVYVDSRADILNCSSIKDAVKLLYQYQYIRLGDYEILHSILGHCPAAPAQEIVQRYQTLITQALKEVKLEDVKEKGRQKRPIEEASSSCEVSRISDPENQHESRTKKLKTGDSGISSTSATGDCTTAEFSKTVDDTRSVQITDALSNANQSVGIIKSRATCGTGFRVGSKYILTCWHVVRDIIKVTDPINRVESLDERKLDDGIVNIEFGFKDFAHNPGLKKFHFEGRVVYRNEDLDYAILEIKNEGEEFPPAMSKLGKPESAHSIFFIGHPDGLPMKEDPGIKIFDRTPELANRLLEANQRCYQLFNTNEFLPLLNPAKVLFHCSFQYGASGSPGVIIEGGETMAVLMLQGGAPDSWHRMSDNERTQQGIQNTVDLVEHGIGLDTIFHDIHKNQSQEAEVLRRDIFGR